MGGQGTLFLKFIGDREAPQEARHLSRCTLLIIPMIIIPMLIIMIWMMMEVMVMMMKVMNISWMMFQKMFACV